MLIFKLTQSLILSKNAAASTNRYLLAPSRAPIRIADLGKNRCKVVSENFLIAMLITITENHPIYSAKSLLGYWEINFRPKFGNNFVLKLEVTEIIQFLGKKNGTR